VAALILFCYVWVRGVRRHPQIQSVLLRAGMARMALSRPLRLRCFSRYWWTLPSLAPVIEIGGVSHRPAWICGTVKVPPCLRDVEEHKLSMELNAPAEVGLPNGAPCSRDGLDKLHRPNAQSVRQCDDVDQTDVTFAPFDSADVVSMQVRQLRQALLRKTELRSQFANASAE
jgi:hypothetical protein